VQGRVRSVVDDLLLPGRSAWVRFGDQWPSLGRAPKKSPESHSTTSHSELEFWKAESRRFAAEVGELRRRLDEQALKQPAPLVGEDGPPLFVPELIEARILSPESGHELAATLTSLDRGQSSGVNDSQWILSGEGILADQGADGRISPDDPIIAGRTVYGRVATVGRWTSRAQHVTDAGFRVHARLFRKSGDELVRGVEGMLTGKGNGHCALELIPGTEPVEVGDLVFTAETIPGVDSALYLGDVAAASLPSAGAHWTIDVTPGIASDAVDRVQIVRIGLHPDRLLPTAETTTSNAVQQTSHTSVTQ
jgi:cell shape-determining protein MreC